jgi:hypothetical protein
MLVSTALPMLTPWLLLLLLAGEASPSGAPIRPVSAPSSLAAVTSNPELSGIVWSSARKRYLVVTDDSGLRELGTYHRPLVLGLGENGVLDEKPIPIHGVDRINDPESICTGPDDTYFVVTSHSPNRSNKTPPARRQLLQLKEDKDGLDVIARLDLTSVKGRSSLLPLVGLPADGRLDIEAVTYHDGALFIGFKSPLTSDGKAVIARIADPLKALREGRLPAESIARFLAVPLCLSVRGQRVCQGISDMLFLRDGSLVLTANAPKGGPKDEGGTLWHLTVPVGQTPPVQSRRFSGLKPEGIALSPSGRSLVVVFDCDQSPAKWTEIPLPEERKRR